MGSSSDIECIKLKGVRQNNLKGFDLDIPLGELVVVTGLSGTGKSSLVFETLHAEGQRRYVETFSPYTRQFLEILDRPDVDSVENIRPSIAIQQSNSVKTSRSTVGTMTELCDYFKVFFSHTAELYDPATGKKIESDSPQTIWKKVHKQHKDATVLIAFEIKKPENLKWDEILEPLQNQGYTRAVHAKKVQRIEELTAAKLRKATKLTVLQDRIKVSAGNKSRFVDAVTTALHFGGHEVLILDTEGKELEHFSEGLHSPKTGERYREATPSMFSFNSPIGACPTCKGFGRSIDIDYKRVIPDNKLSIAGGAIKAFHGEVYGESLRDLLRVAPKLKIRTTTPWGKLTKREKDLVIYGEKAYQTGEKSWPDAWYGVQGFFNFLEKKVYKMHVRFILAKYRSYKICEECGGGRLKAEAMHWKWLGKYTLPDLYNLSVQDLYALVKKNYNETGNHPVDLAAEAILNRLHYLNEVGLGYLTLNRTSRTLSGGEVERVNLTTCLGTSLTETLFVLDEPSIGLHSRDIDRLIGILRRLTDLGNTVVVVEHDEAIMRAADTILEIGPLPGHNGGELTFQGTHEEILADKDSVTGAYLRNEYTIEVPKRRRPNRGRYYLDIIGATKNNIKDLNLKIPLKQLVCIAGVSGSGKSTLMDNILYQGLKIEEGKNPEDPAEIKDIRGTLEIGETVYVDQSPVSKTPRSNPILFVEAWDSIRQQFAQTDSAQAGGMNASHFSFNSGNGRCDHCHGLGYESVEMQFLSDVYVTCPVCEGDRFNPEVLSIRWNGYNVTEILNLTVSEAYEVFRANSKIKTRLEALEAVGLGYLTLGQPLNTLSGGESQRLKLVKYLTKIGDAKEHCLLLLDEPTTGLHRDDINRLIEVLQKLVNQGHSLVIIEHQMDVLKSADWVIEMGPDAGAEGGQVVAQGKPEDIVKAKTESSAFMKEALATPKRIRPSAAKKKKAKKAKVISHDLELVGAREHNLKDISITLPQRELTVLTGVSGSGKSSLAFDIVFAEGQRRFMESISAYARQFVEQLPRPDIDKLTGIAPTVAIEQRITRGSRKSTVATITEVAQYLRLLYARIGIQHSPTTDEPVIAQTPAALAKNLEELLTKAPFKKEKNLYLCAPLVRGRKGHHQPIANWARNHGYDLLRVDGYLTFVENFESLDRYKEHDIEVAIVNLGTEGATLSPLERRQHFEEAIRIGKGSCFLASNKEILRWFSTTRTDPATGDAFPDLDPKHFSWNSPKGWCTSCRGHGRFYDFMRKNEDYEVLDPSIPHGSICPSCQGSRLNPISGAVKIAFKGGKNLSLPQFLGLTPSSLLEHLENMVLDKRSNAIVKDLIPQIRERLQFMDQVGLNYLTLDRSSNTLSGGESQRIRLAAQLSSNLSGVLYVLDEPSIGLHARDNERLIKSLLELRDKGNTLLVVEHDDETMRAADRIIDLGPAAGIHGGEVLANAPINEILKNKKSLTGQYLKNPIKHPHRGEYRKLPAKYKPRTDAKEQEWLVLQKPSFRNLKGQDLHIPIGKLTMVCGISGAGKSTMIRGLLKPATSLALEKKAGMITGKEALKAGLTRGEIEDSGEPFKELLGVHHFKKVIEVDQEPIGKTLRSTPATYIGAFDIIRNFFASIPESKIHGFDKSTYSFNTKGGRCENCSGAGRVKLEMNFLPDTFVSCEACGGDRYGPELSEITWNDKNIAQILAMSFEEAAEFFSFHSQLGAMMELMVETGLGYLTLGQSSPTLSGGEAQRLKLVSELAKGLPSFKERRRGVMPTNLYILEEPTIGLHLRDCERLINILHRLVDQGHTVIVIEHHLDLIAEADYLVEIGPEGGEAGGHVLYQGPAKGLLKAKKSPTAPFLKTVL